MSWLKDPQDDTDKFATAYEEDIREYLEGEGHRGYTMQTPAVFDCAMVSVAILDPEQESPSHFFLFRKPISQLIQGMSGAQPINSRKIQYRFDEETRIFDFELDEGDDVYRGQFNTSGEILEMRRQ